MQLVVNVSVKDIKIFDNKPYHLRGEVRVFDIEDGKAIEEVNRIPIIEPEGVVIKGQHKLNGGTLINNQYVCATFGQIIEVDLDGGNYRTLLSERFFNDVHQVGVKNNEYAVVNTGLEQLLIYDEQFKLVRNYDLLKDVNIPRVFDPSVDYRHVWSTKPHYVHANHSFYYDSEWWVTRFHQKDAMGIESKRRIALEAYGNPHDGIIVKNDVYFTTTNGFLIKQNLETSEQVAWNINMNSDRQLGWCRGLAINKSVAYIGFTQFRNSRAKEMMKWVYKSSLLNPFNSQILVYDLKKDIILDRILFDPRDVTIYSLVLRKRAGDS